jgi:type I restriction enzyme S subunit
VFVSEGKKKIRLGDAATYINGYAFKPEDRGEIGLPIIRIQDLTGNAYDLGFYDGEYPKKIEINNGDVLISWSASLGVYIWNNGKALLNQHIFKVVFDKVEIDKHYFVYAVRNSLKDMEKKSHGATMKHIVKKDFDDTIIPFPPICDQKEISDMFMRLDGIMNARRQELKKIDELVKARFIEMFGDPQINSCNWEVVNISDVIDGRVSNGFFSKRDDYCDDGNVSVLGVANIVNRMYSKIDELPKTNADSKDIEKFEVKYGDMLFCRSSLVAEGIGKASIVPEGVQKKILFECHVIRVPLNLEKCVPEYMQTLSTMDYFRNQVISQAKTATMTTIGQDGILKTNIILPPIEKQRQFYKFVKQVDKSKATVQKALDETQLLFDSLMQEYFG